MIGFFENLSNKCITSLSSFFGVFLKQWHDDEGDMERFIEDSLAILPRKEHDVEALVQPKDLVRMEEPTFFTL